VSPACSRSRRRFSPAPAVEVVVVMVVPNESRNQPLHVGSKKPVAARRPGRPKGTTGPQEQTLAIGRQVRDARELGIPVQFLVACLRSRLEDGTLSKRLRRLALKGESVDVAKRLRHAERAADRADGRARRPRSSTSRAVSNAQKRFHEHSEEHRNRWNRFDGPGPPPRSAAPPGYWESLATRCDLQVAFERAMAKASGRAPNDWVSRQTRQAAAYRARATPALTRASGDRLGRGA
jgi:hypothetical protein